jgi:predicted TIM-barrel fold metal-dependent hydrolase
MQEHYSFESGMQGVMASLIFEGVFERFPKLRVCLIEGGFTWAPAFGWRMDKHWARMRTEVPHVKRPPSEYLREHFWFASQPIAEPENAAHLTDVIDWLGWDRLVFSTDYPHWDFDDPRYTFKINLTESQRARIFRENAKALYRL